MFVKDITKKYSKMYKISVIPTFFSPHFESLYFVQKKSGLMKGLNWDEKKECCYLNLVNPDHVSWASHERPAGTLVSSRGRQIWFSPWPTKQNRHFTTVFSHALTRQLLFHRFSSNCQPADVSALLWVAIFTKAFGQLRHGNVPTGSGPFFYGHWLNQCRRGRLEPLIAERLIPQTRLFEGCSCSKSMASD